MSVRRYPAYKNSGVEWLGEIPAHWLIVPLARITINKCDGPFGSGLKSEHYSDDGVRVIRLQNIRAGQFDATDAAFISEAYFQELPGHDVQVGDVLIAGLGDERNTVGRACVAPEGIAPAMVKADCFRFRLKSDQAHPPYVAMQLTAGAAADAGILATGSTRSRIPLSVMGSRRVALPPLSEQGSISAFLEHETAKIDALVADQEKLIELLKEKRQAVISHVITKGLDPSVPMKDSRIEWLGEVPAHWETPRLGAIAQSIQTGPFGSQLHADDYVDDQIPLINPANIEHDRIVPNWKNTVNIEKRDQLKEYALQNGDIILARRGEMGRCAVVDRIAEGWLCGTGSLIVRFPEQIHSSFLAHYIRTPYVREWLSLQSNGATMENLNAGILSRMSIVVPPLAEQIEIANYLAGKDRNFSALQNTAEQAIDLLKERRSALISAAVTGKIDVRGLVDADALEPA
jgi:type I restriction enzyme S subunit